MPKLEGGQNWVKIDSRPYGKGLLTYIVDGNNVEVQTVEGEHTVGAGDYSDWTDANDSEYGSLAALLADMDEYIIHAGNHYTHITGAATTQVLSSPGLLKRIVINRSELSGTITIVDNTTGTTPVIGAVTFPAITLNSDIGVLEYDINVSTGIRVITTGTNLDITVVYSR